MFYLHNGTYTVKSKILLTNCPSYIHQKKRHISFENQYFLKIEQPTTREGVYNRSIDRIIQNIVEKLPFVYTSEKASYLL